MYLSPVRISSLQQTLHSFNKTHDFSTHALHGSFYSDFFYCCYCCLLCNNRLCLSIGSNSNNVRLLLLLLFFCTFSVFAIQFVVLFFSFILLLLLCVHFDMCRFYLSTYLNKHWHWISASLCFCIYYSRNWNKKRQILSTDKKTSSIFFSSLNFVCTINRNKRSISRVKKCVWHRKIKMRRWEYERTRKVIAMFPG